jgi:hypothetical protein
MQFNTCRSILKLECKAIVKMLNCEFQIGTVRAAKKSGHLQLRVNDHKCATSKSYILF